jgi:PAS domain S-box-containing protein
MSNLDSPVKGGSDVWRAVKENVKLVMDEAPDSVMVTTDGGNGNGYEIVYVNKSFSKITGWDSREVIGNTPAILQGKETDSAVLKDLELTLARGEVFHGRALNYHKNGSSFIMDWRVIPLKVSGGTEAPYYIAFQKEVEGRDS